MATIMSASAPSYHAASRAAIPYPCIGPIDSRVRSTIRSSVPCSTSVLDGGLLDMLMDYGRGPLACQIERTSPKHTWRVMKEILGAVLIYTLYRKVLDVCGIDH